MKLNGSRDYFCELLQFIVLWYNHRRTIEGACVLAIVVYVFLI